MSDDKEYFREQFKRVGSSTAAFLLGVFACVIINLFVSNDGRCGDGVEVVVERDTIVRTDTIRDSVPIPVKEYVKEYVREVVKALPTDSSMISPDTLYRAGNDSIIVPVTQKTYTDDSTYTAWVSGYKANLDSIETYRPITYITETVTKTITKRKRWCFGPQAGAGVDVTTGRPILYVGIGGCYVF